MLALQNLTNVRGNGNRELIGQGLGNMVNAFFGGLPAAGTAVRSATNYKAGGRTRLSGVCFSVATLLLALLGAGVIRFIPKAVIAGMTAVIAMTVADKWSLQFIKRSLMKDASHRRELLLNLSIMIVVSACVVFFSIMTALGVGIAISAFLFLTQMSKSIVRNIYSGAKIHSKRQRSVDTMEVLSVHGDQVAIIELEGPVFFGSTDALVHAIDVLVARGGKYIILDMKRIKGVDVSGARALVQTYTQMRRQDVTIVFSYLYPGTEFRAYLNDLGLLQTVAAEHIFVDTDQALEYCEDLLLARLNTDHEYDETILLQKALGIRDVDSAVVQQLNEYMTEETYRAGELLCRQGDPGDAMYIITKGLIDVTIPILGTNRKRRLGTLGPGTIFGEMSLLDQGKRSADVEVKEDLTCYKITIGHLEELKEEHPGVALLILDTLSKVLVARVRQLTETVAELER